MTMVLSHERDSFCLYGSLWLDDSFHLVGPLKMNDSLINLGSLVRNGYHAALMWCACPKILIGYGSGGSALKCSL